MYRKINGLIFVFTLLCSELAFGKMCFMNLEDHKVRFEVSLGVVPVGRLTLVPGATGCLDMGSCPQNIKYKVVATVATPLGLPGKILGSSTDVRCFDSLYVQSGKLEHNKYHEHNEDTVVCPSLKKGQSILFAHGFIYNKKAWDPFVEHLGSLGSTYRIFRTTIPRCDPNSSDNRNPDVRGLILASYIHWADQKCGIPDRDLISIGHSIGGLDLRYIVHNADNPHRETPYKSAADKLKGVFTIASAHIQLGSNNSTCKFCVCPLPSRPTPPIEQESCTSSPSTDSSYDLPYSDFTNQDIQFVAFRYSLDADQRDVADDGRYCVSDQTFGRYWKDVLPGRHREVNHCKDKNCQPEKPCKNPWLLTQIPNLERILDYSANPDNFIESTEVKE